MPVERGYEPQVQPRGPAGLPQAGAGSFGAQVGAGIEQLGGALERRDDRVRDARANEEQAAVSVELERRKAAQEAFEASMKDGTNPQSVPGGYGTTDISKQRWQEESQALLAQAKDPRVRQNLEVRLAAYAGDVAARTTAFEAGARWTHAKTNFETYRKELTNRVVASTDNAAFGDGLHDLREQAAGLYGLSPQQQEAIASEAEERFKIDFAEARAAVNPAYVRALLASEPYRAIDPDAVQRINRIADVRDAQLAKAAESEKQKAEVLVAKTADGLMGDANRGVAVDPEALRAEAVRVREMDPARAGRFEAAAIGAATNKIYGGGNATPGMMTARLAKIEAAKDWQSNPSLVAEHSALERLRGDERNREPNFAPIDLSNGRALANRVAESATFAATHNNKRRFLGTDQAAELAGMWSSGPAQQLEVASVLSKIPGEWGIVAAEQVAPNNPLLRLALDLPPTLVKEMLGAPDAGKANPKYAPKADMAERWGGRANLALANIASFAPQYVAGIRAAADALYTARAARGDVVEFDQDLYDRGVFQVLDQTGRGNIDIWKKRPILLPKGIGRDSFETRLYNLPRDLGGRATYDGREPINRDALLGSFRPVPIDRDGVYRFVDDSGRYAQGSTRGSFFEVDVRRLSAQPRLNPVRAAPTGPVYFADPTPRPRAPGPVYRAAPPE